MNVFKVEESLFEAYKGLGPAWGAVKNGKLVGLVYMSDWAFDRSKLPEFHREVFMLDQSLFIEKLWRDRDVKIKNTAYLSKVKKLAKEHGYPASISDIHDVYKEECIRQFSEFKESALSGLSELGEVLEGTCSCYQFITLKAPKYVTARRFK